jgi:hypothetical protein
MPRTLIITDSTGASIRWESDVAPTYQQFAPLKAGGSWEFRGESCRAVSVPSCRGRETYKPLNVLEELATVDVGEFDELTIMAGYNEGAENLNGGIQAVLNLARVKGITHVTWLNFCTCSTYLGPASMGNEPNTYGTRNAYLNARAAASNGYLSIADWATLNANDPSLTLYDRSHLTADGAVAVANLMARAIQLWWFGAASQPTSEVAHLQAADQPGLFTGVDQPTRLLDTRSGSGTTPAQGLMLAGESIRVDVATPDATAAVVTLTTATPAEVGYLTAYPCTATVPLSSVSNFAEGIATANTTTVKLDADGGFCVYASTSLHLVVDLYGTFGPTGAGFRATAPKRLIDTRSSGRPGSGGVVVDVGQSALHGIITIVGGSNGYATAWAADPSGVCPARPTASIVNWPSSRAVANRIDIALPGGKLCVATSTPAHIIVDQFGTYDDSVDTKLAVKAPVRLFDSRLVSGPRTAFAVKVPDTAGPTLSVNLVAIGNADGYTKVWSAASCSVEPPTSVTNQSLGIPRANSVMLPKAAMICAVAQNPIHLVLDLV